MLRRIAAGEDEALRELWAAHGQRLYAYAMRLLGDPALAEDVLQESLVVVWQSAGRFRGDGRVIAWLLGIVHRKALHALRSRSTSHSQPWPDEAEGERQPAARLAARLAATDPQPEELVERRELEQQQGRLLQAGLERLSLEHRLALELVFYQGLSLNEAAEVCGCPVGTIKSRLSYAKNSLRGALHRGGLEAEDIV